MVYELTKNWVRKIKSVIFIESRIGLKYNVIVFICMYLHRSRIPYSASRHKIIYKPGIVTAWNGKSYRIIRVQSTLPCARWTDRFKANHFTRHTILSTQVAWHQLSTITTYEPTPHPSTSAFTCLDEIVQWNKKIHLFCAFKTKFWTSSSMWQ